MTDGTKDLRGGGPRVTAAMSIAGALLFAVGAYVWWSHRPSRPYVVVGRHELSKAELDRFARSRMEDAKNRGMITPGQMLNPEVTEKYRREAAQMWVFRTVLLDEALRLKMKASPADEKRYRDSLESALRRHKLGSTVEDWFKSGVLQYDLPYQLELVRPSGVIEHQIVVEGTNEWRSYSSGYMYDGTNLVNMLDAVDQSAKRFFAGEEKARKADGTTFSSLGVTGGAHGEDGGWTAEMRFTPGRLNEGQEDLYDWYLRPMGAAVSIFASVTGSHVGQTLGEETGQDIHVIVGSGTSTYITYNIAPWYAISNITVNGEAVADAPGATGTYRLNLNNVTIRNAK